MDNLKATMDVGHAAAQSCRQTAQEIDGELARLKSYVIGLQERWHGVSADTFGKLMTDYDIFARMLHNALVDIGSGLEGNFVNYENTEKANIANLVAINHDIPGAFL